MAKKTASVRHRSRPPASTVCGDEVEVSRLRTVLDMLAAGRSQVQIARHFGKAERTIHRWVLRAKELQLNALKNTTPQSLVARSLYRLSRLEARLLTTLTFAERKKDRTLIVECHKELRALERDRIAMLDRARFFDGAKWVHLEEEDRRAKQARELQSMVRATFDPTYWSADDSLREALDGDCAITERETIF